MKHFLDLSLIKKNELRQIVESAKSRKQSRNAKGKVSVDIDKPFEGKLLLMVFEKPSTRTRLSFDLAMRQLGGQTIVINSENLHLGMGGESTEDTARVFSSFSDIVMLRTFDHKTLIKFSELLSIPIINGLTNDSHPCQILSDVMTFEEIKGPIEGKTIAWIGDGNNVTNSLIEASALFDFKLNVACPKSYFPSKKVLSWAKKNKADVNITNIPEDAAKDADCIMTDKWISMGDKGNLSKKRKAFKNFQVNKKLMKLAKKDAIFMHDLPAQRGEEVSEDIIDGKQSVVWQQAENRLHCQKGIIEWCLKD
ncbi:MAG: ornithine carbamoyltransferase [Candidatus Fonsibacter sp.]|nr:ornithine carbamoyltransferase [Pelagibacterales bacterium]